MESEKNAMETEQISMVDERGQVEEFWVLDKNRTPTLPRGPEILENLEVFSEVYQEENINEFLISDKCSGDRCFFSLTRYS